LEPVDRARERAHYPHRWRLLGLHVLGSVWPQAHTIVITECA